jgi:hypothetical protein
MSDRYAAQGGRFQTYVPLFNVVAVAAANTGVQEAEKVGHRRAYVRQAQQHHRNADDRVHYGCYFPAVCLASYVTIAF